MITIRFKLDFHIHILYLIFIRFGLIYSLVVISGRFEFESLQFFLLFLLILSLIWLLRFFEENPFSFF